ncbi:methyl-accepting chemotaxis protein [Deltaproteobacteria bacterium TL4]
MITKIIVVLSIVFTTGAIFYLRKKKEIASQISWKLWLSTFYISPVFGTLSSAALGETILIRWVNGDFFHHETHSLWEAWWITGPTLFCILHWVVHLGLLRKWWFFPGVSPKTFHVIPVRIAQTTGFVLGIAFGIGVLRLIQQGLWTEFIQFAAPAHMLTLTYFAILLGYVNVEKYIRVRTEINYGSLTSRLTLNTVFPLIFSIAYMIDAAYLIYITENPTYIVVLRLILAFLMLSSVFTFSLYETLKMVIIPTKQLSNALERISSGDGDLTRRLYVDTRDDLGLLCVFFNRFIAQVHEIVKVIATTSEKVSDSASNLVVASETTLRSTMEISHTLDMEHKSIDSVNERVQQMDVASAGIASNANTTTQHSREMEKLVDCVVDSMSQMVEIMSRINESTSNIGGILGEIRGIAKQTNLLSLNAAIEAAKAAEHGRGFAVVAQHVRELAERSTKATLNIQELIMESANRVREGNLAVGDIQRMLHEVSELVHVSTESVNEINESAKEQSDFVHEVFDEITLLQDLSNTNTQSTRNIKDTVNNQNRAVQSLEDEAHALHSSVSRFKT